MEANSHAKPFDAALASVASGHAQALAALFQATGGQLDQLSSNFKMLGQMLGGDPATVKPTGQPDAKADGKDG